MTPDPPRQARAETESHRTMETYLAFIAIGCALACPLPGAEFAVAPDGDDARAGSPREPFRTIQRAADAMKPGDVCRIRAGVYRETVRVKASGEAGKPIRFAAWPGEAVVLSGTEPVRGTWSVHKGSIYKALVKQDVGQLFVDGEMMVEARWPNQPFERRWDKSTWRGTAEGSEYGRVVDPELAATGVDWTGALAVLNVGAWQTFLRPVQNHTAGSNSFEYARDMGERQASQRIQRLRRQPGFDRYFLYGKLEALDSPGEWFLDRKARTLYLWPPDGKDPSGRQIEGKVRPYAFVAVDRGHIQLEGLRFFAATFLLEGCNDCLVADCDLGYPTYVEPAARLDGSKPYLPKRVARAGRMLLGEASVLAPTLIEGRGNVIRNCRIAFSEAPGLLLAGSENTVENCLIHNVDWRGLGNGAVANCAGVHMAASAKSVFRRNTVHHVGSSEGVVLPSAGPSVCEYNYVHHGGLVQSDGGLIQCNGLRLAGTVIRNNWVHDHQAFHWGGIGIRGDDLTRDLMIHHNVAWRCNEKGIMIKGDRNQAYNNTCIENPALDLVLWAAEEPFKEWARNQHAHLIKVQNEHSKAYNNYAPVLTGQMPHEVRRDREIRPPAAELSHNFSGSAKLIDAKTLTFRKDSPPLTDPAAMDFRPRAGSPLVDAGRLIEGITDAHVGKAPDIGAYEHGCRSYWIPGRQASQASMPIPPHEAEGVRADADLIWLPGYRGTSCEVYFGADAKAVAEAGRNSPLFRGNQVGNLFHPGDLPAAGKCYWRIDTITPAGTVMGTVWSFACAGQPREE